MGCEDMRGCAEMEAEEWVAINYEPTYMEYLKMLGWWFNT